MSVINRGILALALVLSFAVRADSVTGGGGSGGSGVSSVSAPTDYTVSNPTTTPTFAYTSTQTAGALIYGNGTGRSATAAGLAGQEAISNGASAPYWGVPEMSGRALLFYGFLGGVSSTTYNLVGTTISALGAGTGAGTAGANTTTHNYVQLTSGNASGNYEAIKTSTATIFGSAAGAAFTFQVRSAATITSMVHWVGPSFSGGAIAAAGCAPSTSATACGTRFWGAAYAAAASANWLVCDSDASSVQCTDSGVTYNANADTLVACDQGYTAGSTTTCTFNGAGKTQNTTHYNANAGPLECSVQTTTSASANANCGAFFFRAAF